MRLFTLVVSLTLALCLLETGFGQTLTDQWMRSPRWVVPDVQAPGVEKGMLQSEAAGSPVSYFVLKPPGYEVEPERRFPVLYWLHGSGGPMGCIRPMSEHFRAAMLEGKMPPAIVVFPNGLPLGMWVDWKDGTVPLETILIKELIPHIDATYRTIASRDRRIVEGFSMGGYGAARFGLKYPELFCAVSAMGAGPMQRVLDHGPRITEHQRETLLEAVFGGDHDYFTEVSPWVLAERNADAVRGKILFRLAIGELDETLPANLAFHEHLDYLRIAHSFTVVPGVGHDTLKVRDGLGDSNWEFYRQALQ
ncbi:MAG: esterase family protein [Armatimonadetes bacterium]|nr:esterase family protein [Armatimonadota bacterium]